MSRILCKTYPCNSLGFYRYVVVFSRFRGKLLLSRHKQRTTWETQGGHIEPAETPLEAAKRELYEESGAVKLKIAPVCDYSAGEEAAMDNGMVFLAEIEALGGMPESEMAEVSCFEELPQEITYPEITPVLLRELYAQGLL